MWITRISIRNPVFATMFMVGIAVLGIFAYNRLRTEQMPDVSLPFVFVRTFYPGASPEVVETDVTKPIEYAINTVSGVSMMRSNSYDGRSDVFAEFRMSTDMNRAMQDVRDKIATIRPGFARDVKDPLVLRVDQENQQPVVSLAVMSPTASLRDLTSLTDQTIVKALENVPGVARIDVNGRVTRQILVQIKPQALNALGISVDQVANAIRAANQDVPAGRITRGVSDSIVRVEGKIKDPMQFARIIVAQQGGAPIYLSQVADIVDGEKDQDSIARINGRPAITLDLQKAQDGNIVDTGRGIKEAIATLKPRLPADVELRVTQSGADDVEASVNRVKQTIIEGALLTVLIVFLFLHSWRSTVITGLTLPIAVIATFIAIYAFGFSLNFLTLMALSLCIGLLIDDAIVVRENIVRHLGMGKDHVTAAQEATDEIGLAVMATTFAIVAVFVPIAFMSGIIGTLLLPVRRHRRGRRAGVAVRELHARSDAVVGVARPARLALQEGALARPLHGPLRARRRMAARRLRPHPRMGAEAREATHLRSRRSASGARFATSTCITSSRAGRRSRTAGSCCGSRSSRSR